MNNVWDANKIHKFRDSRFSLVPPDHDQITMEDQNQNVIQVTAAFHTTGTVGKLLELTDP